MPTPHGPIFSLTVLAQVLDFAGMKDNPARDRVHARLPREERREPTPPTADQIEAALSLMPLVYALAVLVLDATSMRIGELEEKGVLCGDLDEPDTRWRVRRAVEKGRRGRWVSLPPNLFAAVIATLPPREDRISDSPVFPGVTRTLASTNPCESMIECVRRTSRNGKRWQSGEMALCWTAAGMLEAERQFRRVIGYRELAKLALAAERELHRHPIQEVRSGQEAKNCEGEPENRLILSGDRLPRDTSRHFSKTRPRLSSVLLSVVASAECHRAGQASLRMIALVVDGEIVDRAAYDTTSVSRYGRCSDPLPAGRLIALDARAVLSAYPLLFCACPAAMASRLGGKAGRADGEGHSSRISSAMLRSWAGPAAHGAFSFNSRCFAAVHSL